MRRLRSRRHRGGMRVPRRPRGRAPQELQRRRRHTRIVVLLAGSVWQDAEPAAAPDPAASFVCRRVPNVCLAGCGPGRAGELDRSAVRAMRFARVATSRQAVGSARVAVSRRVVVWLRSRRHDGTMRVPRSPRGSAPPELRLRGPLWARLRVRLGRRSRKSCDFAAAAQELAVRGGGWGCAARVAASRQPHKNRLAVCVIGLAKRRTRRCT